MPPPKTSWQYQCAKEIAASATTAPHVHSSIARVVESALDPDPGARPLTADEMAHLLRETRTHPRNWIRHPAASDIVEYRSTAGGSPLAMVVTREGSRRIVETRYVESRRRVLAGCFETTKKHLARRLRVVFDRRNPLVG